jgi:hypothetical protein
LFAFLRGSSIRTVFRCSLRGTQMKSNCPVNLFQGEGWKRLRNAFRRCAAPEGVDNRVERNTGAADSIGAPRLLNLLLGHSDPTIDPSIIIGASRPEY